MPRTSEPAFGDEDDDEADGDGSDRAGVVVLVAATAALIWFVARGWGRGR